MFPRILHVYESLWIQSYGFMIAVGFLIFLFLTYRHPIRKRVIDGQVYLNGVFWSLFIGVVGARVCYVLTDLQMFYDRPMDIFFPWVGGLVVLGSIVSVLIFAPLYLRYHRLVLFPILDLVAVYAPLMQAISRIGCFLAGCCYGIPASTNSWWTVVFIDSEGIAPLHVALHPAQLYASLASLAVFFLLLTWVRLKKIKPGSPLFMFLVLEGVARFFVDFWRGDRGELISVGLFGTTVDLSQVQLMSVGLCAVSLVGLLIVCSRSTKLYSFEA